MSPALIAIAGPLNGTTVELESPEVTIGREAGNLVCVQSAWVSRRHCALRREGGSVVVQDLESRNGTFVNGIPVTQQQLKDGDLLTVGDCSFRFVCQAEPPAAQSAAVELEETTTVLLAPLWLPAAETPYSEAKAALGSETGARTLRDLSALLTMASKTASVEDSESLYWQLLGMIFEVIPAERGAILLTGNAEELLPAFAWDRASGPDRPVRVSRTVVRQVLERRSAVMVNDVAGNVELRDAQSLRLEGVRSLLCAPLLAGERVLGAIYLDCSQGGACFDEQHLQMLTAVAGLAALASQRVWRIESLKSENQRLRADLKLDHSLVGESAALRRALERIAKIAPSDSTVLLCGESGTGKELAARALHTSSPRAQNAFVAINCAAIPETLLESELFGYEKGAFTGAVGQKKGQFEVANGGSIFLDEIGELAPALQAKLLRVLQQREFVRLGGTQPIKVDVRLIAATNQDLRAAADAGRFRKDLFFRLNVVAITMPSLRERGQDTPLLANYFLSRYSQRCKRRVRGISPQAMECLQRYDWPGNVRELENAIEHAVLLGADDVVMPEDLPEVIAEGQAADSGQGSGYHAAISELKKKLIMQAFQQAGRSYTEAARLLGVHPNYLHRLIRNLNLKASLRATGERSAD
ncbi:MAG TPA: sigma 54-interacting transcriptional regulator [Terriglobales bacterium]|jgi:transcriptional regulator with GAF, ATPase, and Fis domain|nr:sigma 54-interacting transcriptional regulator [Terriglobales bacterium]